MASARDTRYWVLVLLAVTLVGARWHGVEAASVPTDSYRLAASSGASTASTKAMVSTSTSSTSTDATINRCREACLTKHAVPDMACSQTRACSTCWTSCTNSGSQQSTQAAGPRSTLHRCELQLTVQRMVRNESLVTADVSWTSATLSDVCNGTDGFDGPGSSQCLVTWEVSGGGLMGNLLTESPSVQLSLWSDTNYRVQVTCRSKHSSALIRSAPLLLSTSGAAAALLESRTRTPPSTKLQLLSEIAEGDDDEALAMAMDSSEALLDSRRSTVGGSPRPHLHPWPIARESESEIAILALFVAMLLFLLVLLTIVILVKWRPGSTEPAERLEKDVLVENEVMVEILHV